MFRDSSSVRREKIVDVDGDAAAALATWFAFGAGALEELRAETPLDQHPTPPQLWPEHFDIAIELGAEAGGFRAGYGASPGDELHPEPYLYVAPWTAAVGGELWNGRASGRRAPVRRPDQERRPPGRRHSTSSGHDATPYLAGEAER